MKFLVAAAASFVLLASHHAHAGDAAVGEALAEPCASCHGLAGAEPIDNNPIIAGQHEDYLLRSLVAYQNGTRNNSVMNALLAEYQLHDLENMAAYFAAQDSPLN